jgi:unsaturated rhamnogalacturonyl hydrolase
MRMRRLIFCLAVGIQSTVSMAYGQQVKRREVTRHIMIAKQLAAAAMRIWKDSGSDVRALRWTYEQGVVWMGMMRLWYSTGDARYYNYVKRQVDRLVDKDANLATYKPEEYSLDNILCGRVLLELYEVTLDARYYKAAARLREQLRSQYKAMPFWAQDAALFHEDSVFEDIAREFEAIGQHVRDTAGWYGMALVDALDYFPKGHPGRDTLLALLVRYAAAVRKTQAPASAMLVYTLARGVRKGYLPPEYRGIAEAWSPGIVNRLVDNDPKSIGAVILAEVEMDELYTAFGQGNLTVLLDYYFNNERRKDITGASIRYHYTWDDRANSGFSLWGHLFRQYGARTDTLAVAPTAENLKKAAVYIIVDPDDDREVPDPHYLMSAEIGVIGEWVKAGGVLVLMSNDSANAEFEHFNVLAGTFGIQFNYDDYHKVTGNRFEMGAFRFSGKDAIFRTAHKVYIKELSTLRLSPPAQAHFTDSGHVIIAVARVGKGTVFAVGDPWFYNEYTDGRKLPPDFENYNAARDLAQWLLRQVHR